MKTKVFTIIAIALILTGICFSVGEEAPKKLFWQDTITKPNQDWIQKYGYNDESILAFNIRRLYEINMNYRAAIKSLDKEIVLLQNRISELEKKPEDPNEIKE